MHPDLWPRVTDLMHRALEVPAPERRAWIDAHASGDAAIAGEVTRLVEAHDRAGGFLDEALIAQPGAAAAVEHALSSAGGSPPGAGSGFGPYRILREIGRGGMGTVYLAARADDVFEKQVAIKVSPGALVNDALRERFNRERQLLATLDHPGIARILDGGATTSGLQYLVMEYVNGTPIDAYCEAHTLGVDQRLRLFLEVCRAVQYAHDRLIVHRDIKAGNVMIGEDGRPKLLDFGIAKLLSGDDGRADVRATMIQAWTPESASPEQARGEPTTIASDVYGLGALLYRLLTGRAVFDLSGRDTAQRIRIICDEAPERPGAAVARSGAAVSIPADLDAIALKALHKEPGRRYRSAEHLAEDVERHLAQRPVLAAPDGWKYRSGKFVQRHPVATAASAVALIVILSATIAALWQARRANLERDRAQARLTDVRRLARTLIFDLFDRVENTPNATPMRRQVVQEGLAYLDRMAADAGDDPQLSMELAQAYGRLAQVQGLPNQPNLGDRAAARASIEKGRALLAPLRMRPDVAVDIELTDLRLLGRQTSTVDPERAQQLAREGIARATALRARAPDRREVIETQANAYFAAALAEQADERLRLFTEAGRAFSDLSAQQPGDASYLRSVALTEKYIGAIHHTGKRLSQALVHYQRALELDRQVQSLRPNDRQTLIDLGIDLGNLAAVHREGVPPDLAQAARLYRESLALRERAVALDPQDVFARQAVAYALIQLADALRRSGEADEAVQYGRRGAEAYKDLPQDELIARQGYAWLVFGQAARESSNPEACVAFRRARDLFVRAAAGPSDERIGLGADTLALVEKELKTCQP